MSAPGGPQPPDGWGHTPQYPTQPGGQQPAQGTGQPQGYPPQAQGYPPQPPGYPPQGQGYPTQPHGSPQPYGQPPDGAQPYGPAPGSQGYPPTQPQGYPPQPAQTQPYPQAQQYPQQPQGAGQPPYAQGYGPVAVGGQPPKPRKGRLALISGAVVVALVLTAGGVLAVTNGWFGRAGGASSPEAAANSFLRSAVKLDGGDILAAFPPSERALVAEVVDLVENQSRTDAQARSDAVDGARSALSISMPTAPVFATEELVPGVAKARITGGTLRLDGDPDQLADALMSIMDASGVPAETLVAREQLRADLATELPVDMELTDLVSIAGVDDFFVVSVEEGGKWYISLTMTLAQYAAEAAGVTKDRLGHVIPPQEMKTFSNPDDAVVGLFNAINQAVNTGDTTELAKVLPPAESRLVAVYGPVLFGEPRNAGDTQSPFAVSDLSASTLQTKGDHAWVALDTFTIDLGAASTVKYARDGKKYTITGLDHNTEVLTVVLDGNDPRKWSFTMTDDSEDYTGSLSIPVPGQLAGEYFRTFTWPYLDDPFVQSASFLFDGTCVTLTYDGDSEPADCLPETVSWLDNVDTFPDMARLLSVTTLKSGDSWYASPSATLISFGTELARTFGS